MASKSICVWVVVGERSMGVSKNWLHPIKVGYGLSKFKNFSAKIKMVDVT